MTRYNPSHWPYLPNSSHDGPVAYVYAEQVLICRDCYRDEKTTRAQRHRCKPVFSPEEFQEENGTSVNCAWCHEVIVEASDEDDEDEEDTGEDISYGDDAWDDHEEGAPL